MIFQNYADLRRFFMKQLALLGLNEKRCALCREPHTPSPSPFPSQFLCPSCQAEMQPFTGPRCAGCGLPIEERKSKAEKNGKASSFCTACVKSPPPWQGVAYYGLYAGRLRDAVLALKYSGSLNLCSLFSDLLLESSKCLPVADLLVPVPVSTSRLKIRGYNQALEIARSLSAKSSIKLSCEVLYRIKDSCPQEGLSAEERRKNLCGVFRASSAVRNKRIWILDDVMTTGSTLEQCAKALLDAGAKRVSLLFLARTGGRSE